MADQQAKVKRSVKSVEEHVLIEIGGKLATIDGALQDAESLGAAGKEPSVAEGGDEFRVGLASANEGAKDAPTRSAEDDRQALHLGANVFLDRASIGEAGFADNGGHERVGHKDGLVGPPAVDGGFADAGGSGHGLDGQLAKPYLLQ